MYDIWYTEHDMWYKIYNTGNVLQQLLQLKFDLAKLANLTNITLQNQKYATITTKTKTGTTIMTYGFWKWGDCHICKS